MSRFVISAGLTLVLWGVGGATEALGAPGTAPSLHIQRIVPDRTGGGAGAGGFLTAMVKFVCGTPSKGELGPGLYFTAINIAHRGGPGAQPVDPVMDVVPTNGGRAVTGIRLASIPGASGVEVDCPAIASHLKVDLSRELVKGFVRFTADLTFGQPLDRLEFVTVYTATGSQ